MKTSAHAFTLRHEIPTPARQHDIAKETAAPRRGIRVRACNVVDGTSLRSPRRTIFVANGA
jgi:hypothetical protein